MKAMKESKFWCFFLFQQAPSIKSQSSDTPLEGETPLSHNLEGQVIMLNILEMKFHFTSPALHWAWQFKRKMWKVGHESPGVAYDPGQVGTELCLRSFPKLSFLFH